MVDEILNEAGTAADHQNVELTALGRHRTSTPIIARRARRGAAPPPGAPAR
jgi:hypothetical protein